MNTNLIDDVKQDHALLCGELDFLKKAEGNDSPPSWPVLQEICARLATGLREHIRWEKQLFPNHRSLGAAALAGASCPSIDHYGDYRYLQVITRYIALENRPFLLNNRYHLLTDFLRGLRHHMDEQEAQLFPDEAGQKVLSMNL